MSDLTLYRLCVALVALLAAATAGEVVEVVAWHRWDAAWLAAVHAATVAVLGVVLYRDPPGGRPRR